MSLVAFALRQLTRQAILGKTLAGVRVLDSEIAALDLREANERAPTILLYTDDLSLSPNGRDLLGATPTIRLVVVVMVAQGTAVMTDSGEDGLDVGVPPTSAGLELSLDLIGRAFLVALLSSNDPWSELWRELVTSVTKVERPRGDDDKNSARFAVHQWTLTCETLDEPGTGSAPSGFWAKLIAAMANSTDAEFATLAPVLVDAIVGTPLPEWRQAKGLLGLTDSGVRGLGVTPADPTEAEDASELVQIVVDGDDGDRVIEADV